MLTPSIRTGACLALIALGLPALVLGAATPAMPAAATEPAAASASAPAAEEELLPVSKTDQAVVLYRSVCLAALVDRASFTDLALARGLTLTTKASGAVQGMPVAEDDLVFAAEGEEPIEVTIRGQQRCSVWVRAPGGTPVRRSFERAVNDLRVQGYALKWVMDRAVDQKDAPRRLLRAESVLSDSGVRVRFDAALVATDKRSGLQALVVQIEPLQPPAPPAAAPAPTPAQTPTAPAAPAASEAGAAPAAAASSAS